MPFLILFVLDKQVHLCYLLKHEMKEKRSNQSKVPSINKQALFSFPSLSFFATSCIYSGAFFRSQSKRALGARSLLPDVGVIPDVAPVHSIYALATRKTEFPFLDFSAPLC